MRQWRRLAAAISMAAAALILPAASTAQRTQTTGTIVDSNGNPYVNCTGSANFFGENTTPGAGPYLLSGSTFQTVVPIFCDSFGHFAVTLADNNAISPTPSQWRFAISSGPGYQGGIYSFTVLITITGATQDVSSQLSVASAPLPVNGGGGGGNNPYAVVINPATPLQNVILPQSPTLQGLTVNAPVGAAPTLDTLQVNDSSLAQVLGVQANDTVQVGPNAQGPATFNIQGGINPSWLFDSDPYCVYYGQLGQVTPCNLYGMFVVGMGGLAGQNFTAPWMPAVDFMNTQPYANNVVPIYDSTLKYFAPGPLTSSMIPNNAANTSGTAANATALNGGSVPASKSVIGTNSLGQPIDASCAISLHVGSVPGSSDTLSAAGAFATTLSLPGTCLAAKSLIAVHAHGVYTTTSTVSPQFSLRIDAGGTTGICPAPTNAQTLTTSQTVGYWDAECFIQINTTGSGGTAVAWGKFSSGAAAGAGVIQSTFLNASTGTVAYNTSIAETLTVRETATLVSGQTFNLTALDAVINP
jgi:hypothetical protein